MIYSAELVAVGGGFDSKKSEKLEDGIWSPIEEPPVDGIMYEYAVIFHGSSHYYFGGYSGDHAEVDSILRLQSGSWIWSKVGRLNLARRAHAVILVGEKFMVVGGYGNINNEACLLDDVQFNCTKLPSSLDNYEYRPIVYHMDENYGSC